MQIANCHCHWRVTLLFQLESSHYGQAAGQDVGGHPEFRPWPCLGELFGVFPVAPVSWCLLSANSHPTDDGR